MSTTLAGSQSNRAPSFWQSTNGKKVVMAVTGAILFLFVVGHLLGNLQIFDGPDRINAYGHFLKSLGELLWIVRGTLLLCVVLHIVATVQLALRNRKARPVGYKVKKSVASNYADRTMYWSGPILLAFVIFHLLEFTAGTLHPGAPEFSDTDIYYNVVTGFSVWWVSAWYIFSMILLGFHLRHGIWSMFQSLGVHHPRHTPLLQQAALWIAILITAGYISIPVSVLLGVVR
ncbi:MAG TPA: succinate dehydrogenase cytochrome b subunit [Acidobacteriaceae bacterium]|jgi:succinate dehydrogenase / fumarate reductase cytochrome b subunit|nr:succinate dehydrogenase cytochrome b subunit [Acidobacteriaceae bacterium]